MKIRWDGKCVGKDEKIYIYHGTSPLFNMKMQKTKLIF
jgi:hypothetical protein